MKNPWDLDVDFSSFPRRWLDVLLAAAAALLVGLLAGFHLGEVSGAPASVNPFGELWQTAVPRDGRQHALLIKPRGQGGLADYLVDGKLRGVVALDSLPQGKAVAVWNADAPYVLQKVDTWAVQP